MDGTVKIKSLESDIKIIRDNEGIPHIYAKSRVDMLFGLGFVMGSDRLFQYDMIRRAGAGRTAELIGKKTLPVDILFRTLASQANFQKKIDQLPMVVKNELEAFYAGMNYYIKNYPRPIEYRILGASPEPFSIVDAYSVYLYLAYSFSPMLKDKPMYDIINKTVTDRNLKLLHSNKIDENHSQSFSLRRNIDLFVSNFRSTLLGIEQLLSNLSPIEGSNAWVISGKLSKSGFPILSSDPHISFSAPNLWYEAHTIVENGDEFYGHFLPLIPFPAMGHSHHHGWGLTMSYNDDMDLSYEVEEDFEIKKENIKVRNEVNYELTLKLSKNGPLINHLIDRKDNISMNWGVYLQENRPIKAFYELSQSQTMSDIKRAVSMAKSPGMNILYADREGNIAHFILGALFKRTDNISSTEIKDQFDFGGIYDYKLSPHRENPNSQMLISTNDRPEGPEVPLRGIWYPKNRHDTVKYLLEQKDKWTADEMTHVQTSSLDYFSLGMRDVIISDLANEDLNEIEKYAYDELKKWDGKSTLKSIGASIYNHFNYLVIPEITDEMNKSERYQYCTTTSSWYFYQRLLKDPTNQWWDIKSTSEIERRSQIIFKVFKKTILELTSILGHDVQKWNWEKLHTIEFPHPFGMNKYLARIFNQGPYPVAGAINDINHFRRKGCEDGHKVKSGPSTRRIVDFSHPERSLGILPLGNSGHMLSPFFDNQRERFLKGLYRPQLMNKEDILKAKSFELVLKKDN